MEWEVAVADGDVELRLESGYTHGAEVAPRSDVVGEQFESDHGERGRVPTVNADARSGR